jgi:hypothetical protein
LGADCTVRSNFQSNYFERHLIFETSPQEKPKPTLPPPAPPVVAPAPTSEAELPAQEDQPDSHVEQGWEDPTTVQAPTWDDEPHVPLPAAAQASSEWTTASQVEEVREETANAEPLPETPQTQQWQGTSDETEKSPAAPVTATFSPPPGLPTPALTPSSKPVRSNRAKYNTDQPVVMPSTFASTFDRFGMQFGSLSLSGDGGDDVVEIETTYVF